MITTDVEAIPIEVDVKPLKTGGIAPYVTGQGVVETPGRMLV